MTRKRVIHGLLWTAGAILVLVLMAVASVTWLLRASLPRLDGEFRAAGVHSEVVIERDDLGVPTITAGNRLDAVRALGFLHGQDRFFQMDLVRRSAAGELAALLGPAALDQDKRHGVRRFRQTAEKALAELPPDQQELVQCYAQGVNGVLCRRSKRLLSRDLPISIALKAWLSRDFRALILAARGASPR
jgi:penicillin G amidase